MYHHQIVIKMWERYNEYDILSVLIFYLNDINVYENSKQLYKLITICQNYIYWYVCVCLCKYIRFMAVAFLLQYFLNMLNKRRKITKKIISLFILIIWLRYFY